MLTSPHRHIGRVPGRGQIVGQTGEAARVDLDGRWAFDRLARFQIPHATQRGLPVLLQLRGDQTVVGIAGSIAAFGETDLVASLLQFQIVNLALIFLSFPVHSLSLERGLDRQGFYCAQQLARNRRIGSWAAKGHAPGQAHHQVRLVTAIDGPTSRIAGVGDTQSPAASSARHDTRQQRLATTTRLHAAGAAIVVERQLLLIALILLPADVSFVMIFDHHFPGSDRLAMPVAPACSPIDDGSSLLGLPVHVNAGIEGIFENRDHIAVADRLPVKAGHAALIGRSREVYLIGFHRQQHLARAAKLAEAGEDKPDHFLQAQIGVEAQTGFAMPDVAEGYRQA